MKHGRRNCLSLRSQKTRTKDDERLRKTLNTYHFSLGFAPIGYRGALKLTRRNIVAPLVKNTRSAGLELLKGPMPQ